MAKVFKGLCIQKCNARKEEKLCTFNQKFIQIHIDTYIKAKEKEKMDAYMPLLIELKSLYPQHTVTIIPVVIGAMGIIHNALVSHLMATGMQREGAQA